MINQTIIRLPVNKSIMRILKSTGGSYQLELLTVSCREPTGETQLSKSCLVRLESEGVLAEILVDY
jgi:hypothetical protein